MVSVSDGAMQNITYDEFGKTLADGNPGFQPFGFAGGVYDHQVSLTKFGVRDYDPEVGRWLTKDQIFFNGGDANLYGYVLMDPVNWVDITGEFPSNLIEAGECIWGNPKGQIESLQQNLNRNNAEIARLLHEKKNICTPNNFNERRIRQLRVVNEIISNQINELQSKCSGFFKGGI